MQLDNFKIKRIDNFNITWCEYREVEKKDHSKVMTWVAESIIQPLRIA